MEIPYFLQIAILRNPTLQLSSVKQKNSDRRVFSERSVELSTVSRFSTARTSRNNAPTIYNMRSRYNWVAKISRDSWNREFNNRRYGTTVSEGSGFTTEHTTQNGTMPHVLNKLIEPTWYARKDERAIYVNEKPNWRHK